MGCLMCHKIWKIYMFVPWLFSAPLVKCIYMLKDVVIIGWRMMWIKVLNLYIGIFFFNLFADFKLKSRRTRSSYFEMFSSKYIIFGWRERTSVWKKIVLIGKIGFKWSTTRRDSHSVYGTAIFVPKFMLNWN